MGTTTRPSTSPAPSRIGERIYGEYPSHYAVRPNYRCRWRVLVTINARVNDTATTQTETAIDALLALIPKTVAVESVNSPQLLSLGAQGTVISTEINLTIEMKE